MGAFELALEKLDKDPPEMMTAAVTRIFLEAARLEYRANLRYQSGQDLDNAVRLMAKRDGLIRAAGICVTTKGGMIWD